MHPIRDVLCHPVGNDLPPLFGGVLRREATPSLDAVLELTRLGSPGVSSHLADFFLPLPRMWTLLSVSFLDFTAVPFHN